MKIVNQTKNIILANKVRYCNSFWSRMMGLLGTSQIEPQEACWLKPCNQVHTFGMKYTLDIYFLDQEGRILSIKKNLTPNRISPLCFKSKSIIEFASSPEERPCTVGDLLTLAA